MGRGMRCGGCGSVLRDRPDSCPLCGIEIEGGATHSGLDKPDPDSYHDNVRRLREELEALRRGDAEAV